MILILSQISLEETTNAVIDWLELSKANYKKMSLEDFLHSPLSFTFEGKKMNVTFSITRELEIKVDDINIIWNRRWSPHNDYTKYTEHELLNNRINVQVGNELKKMNSLLFSILAKKKWLSYPETANVHKLKVLEIANEVGIRIPETIITNNKLSLSIFKNRYNKIITKSIGEGIFLPYEGKTFCQYTSVVTDEAIKNAEDYFFPSLFQEYVEKEIELRIFYLDQCCYSMAIFSQNNKKTEIDFRKYDVINPNRYVPFRLPKLVEEKINELMAKLNLNTGSIDMIKSKNNEYVFLEVNPKGQFGMVSIPCNYYLEKKVAHYLIKNDEK